VILITTETIVSPTSDKGTLAVALDSKIWYKETRETRKNKSGIEVVGPEF